MDLGLGMPNLLRISAMDRDGRWLRRIIGLEYLALPLDPN